MKRILLIVLIMGQCIVTAFSYNAVGHRIVADIAYGRLTDKARSHVDAVLGVRGIVYYSSWADEIKSDESYSYSYQWHFQNLSDSLSPKIIKQLWHHPQSDGRHLFFALDSLSHVLRHDGTNAEALKFIVHFVGDCMQPLHLGRAEDLGGNRVYMKWFGKNTNIHTIWDRYLIEYTQYSYSEYSQYLCDRYGNDTLLSERSLLECVQQCYAIRQAVYDYHNEGDANTYHYAYRFLSDMDKCLYMAGVQLADLLNDIYR